MTSTTDADSTTTGFQYDALGRVTGVLDAHNQQYEFAYDAVGRQTGITRAGVSMTYAYDAVGNRTQRTDYNGTVTSYAYDNLNRLTTITYPTRTMTYTYTVLGQIAHATNENGTVYLGYDSRNRLSNVTDPLNYGVTYNYDATGNRTNLSLNNATYATYTYDAVNRLTDLKDAANQSFPHSYDASNRLTSRGAPNGVTTSEAYDGLDRLTALTHSTGATTLLDNQYQYDSVNNIRSWTNAAGDHDYEYDPVNRLLAATNSVERNENYTYDEVGNRTSSHLDGNYKYRPFNKLVERENARYNYDNNGNLTSRLEGPVETLIQLETLFIWNEENQLTEVDLPNGEVVNYKYDALGRRIQRTTTSGANERYVYDGNDVLLDLNADWSVATTYLNGPGIDNHLRQTSATSGISYYLTDHLGSTAALTDATGNIVEQLAYDSFGNSSGSSLTRYTYTGREFDADAGLYYYRTRFYDPQGGRFISEDPIGLIGGLNQYAYVENQPTNAIDPFGLQRLAPLGGSTRPEGITREELHKKMMPPGSKGLPEDVMHQLDRGCIGMVACYMGKDKHGNYYEFPEDAPGVRCYLEINLAKARKCGRCCRNLVFGKQGWLNESYQGTTLVPDARGQVLPDSVSGARNFNYVMWFPSTRRYGYMNWGNGLAEARGYQRAYIDERPPRWPLTIWCSFCKPVRR